MYHKVTTGAICLNSNMRQGSHSPYVKNQYQSEQTQQVTKARTKLFKLSLRGKWKKYQEKVLKTIQNRVDTKHRVPVLPKNVQTHIALQIYVWVINLQMHPPPLELTGNKSSPQMPLTSLDLLLWRTAYMQIVVATPPANSKLQNASAPSKPHNLVL